jgi:glycosyltransferase involved in cell wall biosynthesis
VRDGPIVDALNAALALRREPALSAGALRGLRRAAAAGDPSARLLSLHALARRGGWETDAAFLAALRSVDRGEREHAAWVLGERAPDARALPGLRAVLADGGFGGMLAELTLERWSLPPCAARLPGADGPLRPRRARAHGLRVAQVLLQGRLDGRLQGAGAGDGGGLATLLVGLGRALGTLPGVAEVVTFARAFDDPALPGMYDRLTERVGESSRIERIRFGPSGYLPAAEQWPYRAEAEHALMQAVLRSGIPDVAHLRFADAGTLAAARVFRRLGVPIVFTLAPDPHAVLSEAEAAGRLDRASFAAADADEHYVFRARLVDWLARRAHALAVMPRPGGEAELGSLLGASLAGADDRLRTVPEGIDVAASTAAARAHERSLRGGGPLPAAARELASRVAALPEGRRGLPVLLTVSRLHPVKGIPLLVEAWAGDDDLFASFNLVVVGGELERPSAQERAVLAGIEDVLQSRPSARAGLILFGHRPNAEIPQLLQTARLGVPGAVAPRGIYACPSRKEEFGLALLEAMAAGLAVVAPVRGGPATYVENGRNGVLAGTSTAAGLREGLRRAAASRHDEALGARARRTVLDRFTIDRMAAELASLYAEVADAAGREAA